jgi:hypothetical protein
MFVGHGEHTNDTHFLGSLLLTQLLDGEVQIRFDVDQACAVYATNTPGWSVILSPTR